MRKDTVHQCWLGVVTQQEIMAKRMPQKVKDGAVFKDIHLEDVLAVPENARNYEKSPLQLEDDPLEVDVESLDQKRSPGMMLEDKERREKDKKDKAGKPISPGKAGTGPYRKSLGLRLRRKP